MSLAHDRRQMMLAGRNHGYVAQKHCVVIILSFGEDAAEQFRGIDRIAGKPFAISASDPRRRVAQALPVRVVAGRRDQGPYRLLDVRSVRPRRRRRHDSQAIKIDLFDGAFEKLHGYLPYQSPGWMTEIRGGSRGI